MNVIQFPINETPVACTKHLSLNFDKDGALVNIAIHNFGDIEDLRTLMEACFRASWWLDGEYNRRMGGNAPDRVLMLMKLHHNAKVHVMVNDGDDSFEGPVRQEWLRKRLAEALEIALPLSSEALPASGMTSPSLSHNSDQLEFSW